LKLALAPDSSLVEVPGMKKLVALGQVVVGSGRPRTRVGPDSRGLRICFAQIGRSCSLKTAYYTFTDGSAYVYSPISNLDAEALCASPIRGRAFNFAVRRALVGFVRGFVPPGDFEVIYSFPPYAGSQPAACSTGTLDWTLLVWDTYTLLNFPPDAIVTGVAAGDSFNGQCQGINLDAGISPVHASLTFTGPSQNCELHFDLVDGTGNFPNSIGTCVLQDGVVILDCTQFVFLANGPQVFPFLVGAGVGSLIEVVDLHGLSPQLWGQSGFPGFWNFSGQFVTV
jgi:hypothetical protein